MPCVVGRVARQRRRHLIAVGAVLVFASTFPRSTQRPPPACAGCALTAASLPAVQATLRRSLEPPSAALRTAPRRLRRLGCPSAGVPSSGHIFGQKRLTLTSEYGLQYRFRDSLQHCQIRLLVLRTMAARGVRIDLRNSAANRRPRRQFVISRASTCASSTSVDDKRSAAPSSTAGGPTLSSTEHHLMFS